MLIAGSVLRMLSPVRVSSSILFAIAKPLVLGKVKVKLLRETPPDIPMYPRVAADGSFAGERFKD